MILLDLNQIVWSNLMQQINSTKNEYVEDNFLRNMILSSIRRIQTKFSAEYGEVVLCDDASNYWRKEVFPYYKAHRKKSREESFYNWPMIYNKLNKIKMEIRENMPYKYVRVAHCEADDIIAVITKTYSTQEPILIVSGDSDFVQLFRYPNVKQYSPVHKKFVEEKNPHEYLLEKIIHGDRGDGIPNVLSDDDTFVVKGKRQRRITEEFLKREINITKNYLRNEQLIDFAHIPESIQKQIIIAFEQPMQGSFKKAYEYLHENNLKIQISALMENNHVLHQDTF